MNLNFPPYKVNARTYRTALKANFEVCLDGKIKLSIKKRLKDIPKSKITSWIEVDPIAEKELLSFNYNGQQVYVPFFNNEEVFMTTKDVNSASAIYEFSSLQFTESAFIDGMSMLVLEEGLTSSIEKLGEEISQKGMVSESEADDFCKKVCHWGRQNRVYANIKRYSPNDYQKLLSDWFNFTLQQKNLDCRTIKSICKMGDDIPGLGVSFVSKHLRMLNPNEFPVLDDVLAKGLGFMLNENGYVLFIKNIKDFMNNNKQLFVKNPMNIAKFEMGLFLLTRQFVRSEDEPVE